MSFQHGAGSGVGRWVVIVAMLLCIGLTGCKKAQVVKDYARPLPPGAKALRKLHVSEWPSLTMAVRTGDASLIQALDHSASWFAKPSSRQFYPMEGITFDQAHASVVALRQILATSRTMGEFNDQFTENFDIYTSVGWDGNGGVLYTGYYSPVVHASRTRTGEYQYPLYRRPADLVSDPVTGNVLGRKTADGSLSPYPSRSQIEATGMLQGQELVWMKDKLDCYLVQVQGSAKLIMNDGSTMLIGYAGNNGHQYTGIGKLLVADGKLDGNSLSLPAIRQYFRQYPQELDGYIRRNDRFVFFKEYDEGTWPAGSLGVEVTAMRTIATDKTVFPRGLATLVVTQIPTGGIDQTRPFEQFMLDQDTGGAILAPGRADIYMGTGAQAEQLAGRQVHEGRLYYLILKPEKVAQWLPASAQGPAGQR